MWASPPTDPENWKFPPHQNTFPGGKVAAKRTDEGTGSPWRGTDYPNFGLVPRVIDSISPNFETFMGPKFTPSGKNLKIFGKGVDF
jgi:hypothetical protein